MEPTKGQTTTLNLLFSGAQDLWWPDVNVEIGEGTVIKVLSDLMIVWVESLPERSALLHLISKEEELLR